MAQDVFPATLNTWIAGQLQQGQTGLLNVNHHLMSTYAWPLKVYYLGTNARTLGEADDVVEGFFANRLSQNDFLGKWQASGMRLRRWLMNAFCFYLKELRRHERPRVAAGAGGASDRGASADRGFDTNGGIQLAAASEDPEVAFTRAAAISFVQRAMQQAADECHAENLDQHWEIFQRHHLDGRCFADISREYGVNAARATVMARTATRKFRNALRDVLAADGVSPDQIDEEIQLLLKEIGS